MDKGLLTTLLPAEVAQFDLIEQRALSVPAGRWFWDIRPETKSVTLIAPGFGGDTVLTAHRWGMNGATIWMPSAEPPGYLAGLEEDAVAFPKRDHHKWARTSERPTAVFLAHARADNDFLRGLVRKLANELMLVSGVKVEEGEEVSNG
jgi:hypothetical protein